MSTTTRERRSQAAYEIEAATKCLQVLEALEGIAFEPVTASTVAARTGFTLNFCFRALQTLALRGYAVQTPDGRWTVGPRIRVMASRISACNRG